MSFHPFFLTYCRKAFLVVLMDFINVLSRETNHFYRQVTLSGLNLFVRKDHHELLAAGYQNLFKAQMPIP